MVQRKGKAKKGKAKPQRSGAHHFDARSFSNDHRRFVQQLGRLALEVVNVDADGNCLFRAMADQQCGDVGQHERIRAEAVAFIEANRDDFEPFMEDDEPFDRYVNRMRRDAQWGGQLEITAIARKYAASITIHQLDMPRWQVLPDGRPAAEWHLSYHDEMHYSSVRPVGKERQVTLLAETRAGSFLDDLKAADQANLRALMEDCDCTDAERAWQVYEAAGFDYDAAAAELSAWVTTARLAASMDAGGGNESEDEEAEAAGKRKGGRKKMTKKEKRAARIKAKEEKAEAKRRADMEAADEAFADEAGEVMDDLAILTI